jgi:glycosyltransferase involved in cell wall biosynthesis
VDDPVATVLIRTKNEAASLGRLIETLREQTLADRLQLVMVDSGSEDETVQIARALGGVEIIEMPAEDFTFGRSLNIGCATARAPFVISLSAHAFPPDGHWVERMIEACSQDGVACAAGSVTDHLGRRLDGALIQDAESSRRHPTFGYSNAGGIFRTALWREYAFREDMPGTEDLEWAAHWLERGWLVAIDPALVVDHDHSHDPLPSVYRRARREWAGFAMYLDLPPYPLGELVREWWSQREGHSTHLRARTSPWRLARLLGKYSALNR